MQTEAECSLMQFGHGIFQDVTLCAYIYQEHCFKSDGEVLIGSDQYSIIGIEMVPSGRYSGSRDGFSSLCRRFATSMELNYAILHEDNEVLLESNPIESYSFGNYDFDAKRLTDTKDGVMMTFPAMLKVSSMYHNLGLTLQITVSVELLQGKPFNQRLDMGASEMDVRLLLDLNRYRPPKLPSRTATVAIRIVEPISIESRAREVAPMMSILSVTLRNQHVALPVWIREIEFHCVRTEADERDSRYRREYDAYHVLQKKYSGQVREHNDWFEVKLLAGPETITSRSSTEPAQCTGLNTLSASFLDKSTDTNSHGTVGALNMTLNPGETVTVLYQFNVAEFGAVEGNSEFLSTSKALRGGIGGGVYSTPLSVSWCFGQMKCSMKASCGSSSAPVVLDQPDQISCPVDSALLGFDRVCPLEVEKVLNAEYQALMVAFSNRVGPQPYRAIQQLSPADTHQLSRRGSNTYLDPCPSSSASPSPSPSPCRSSDSKLRSRTWHCYDQTVKWSIGTSFRPTTSPAHESAVSQRSSSSTESRCAIRDYHHHPAMLDVAINGPQIAHVGMEFALELCVLNTSPHRIGNATVYAGRIPSASNTSTDSLAATVISGCRDAPYMFQDTAVALP